MGCIKDYTFGVHVHIPINISYVSLQLLYLKLVSVLFPTSDFRHPVTTPAMLYMSHILTQVSPFGFKMDYREYVIYFLKSN